MGNGDTAYTIPCVPRQVKPGIAGIVSAKYFLPGHDIVSTAKCNLCAIEFIYLYNPPCTNILYILYQSGKTFH